MLFNIMSESDKFELIISNTTDLMQIKRQASKLTAKNLPELNQLLNLVFIEKNRDAVYLAG